MSVSEKLKLMEEIDDRNAEREREFLQAQEG